MNFNFKKLPPFKWFVLQNFPFIEADFDAITYYQLLCKIVEYLNKVIDENNVIGEQTENLTNAFNELQDYVNHYFDSLDIQEEINNKLDEMAESGQLTDIIAQYLKLAGVLSFNTVNEMKNAENVVNGTTCYTLGNTTFNDGYGSFYKIRYIKNTDHIDNNQIIPLNNFDNLVADKINNYYILDMNNRINSVENDFDNFSSNIQNTINTQNDNIQNNINDVQSFKNNINSQLQNMNDEISSIQSTSPIVVNSVSQMSDTSKIYINTTDNKWYYYNGTSWVAGGTYGNNLSFTYRQFFESNSGIMNLNNNGLDKINLMDIYHKYDGVFLNPNGGYDTNADYSTTDFIPILPNTALSTNYNNKQYYDNIFIGFYDINKNWISRIYNVNNSTTPANAYYCRISFITNLADKYKIYLKNSIPTTDLQIMTPFYRKISIVRQIPKARNMRGSLVVTNVDDNNNITLTASQNCLIYAGDNYTPLNSGDYVVPINHIAIFDMINRTIKTLPIYVLRDNIDIVRNFFLNGYCFLCANDNGFLLTDNYDNRKVYVDKNGFLTYNSVTLATKRLHRNFLTDVYIADGEYEEQIEMWNYPYLRLHGSSKEHTILYNTTGNYTTPCAELSGGFIENLTFYSKKDSKSTTEDWSAYAVHIESNNLSDNILYFKNVKFMSDFNWCVGMGLRKNCKVIFEECDFISNSNPSIQAQTPGGCLYFHDSNFKEYYGTSEVIVKNCYFQSNYYDYAIQFYSLHLENTVNLTFINNTFWCKNNETQNIILANKREGITGGYLDLGNWQLLYPSSKNTINVLNH